jgi:hypothetical protein
MDSKESHRSCGSPVAEKKNGADEYRLGRVAPGDASHGDALCDTDHENALGDTDHENALGDAFDGLGG